MASLMVQLKGIKGEARVKALTLAVLATFSFGCAAPQLQPPANPLPSWNDGPARQSIIALKGLDEAAAQGWTLVDMKTEWKQIFEFEP